MWRITLFLLPLLFFFQLSVSDVHATIFCSPWVCCTDGYYPGVPEGCNPLCTSAALGCGIPCTGKSTTLVCTETTSYTCGYPETPSDPLYGICRYGSTACMGGTGSGCVAPAPTPPPGPTLPPAGGTCTSGDPFYNIANCGAVGRDDGSGSCGANCRCCVPKGGYVAACSWNPSSPSPCTPDGVWTGYGTPSFAPCCDGLVGSSLNGVCGCPGACSVALSHNNITLSTGQTLDLRAYVTNLKSPSVSRVQFTRSTTAFTYSPGIDSASPYKATLTALTPGSGTFRATASSADGRTVCARQTTVTVIAPAPAPPPPTINSPAEGELVVPVDANNGGPTKAVDISFTTQPDPTYTADRTYIEIYPQGTNCSNPLAKCEYVIAANNAPPETTISYRYHIPIASYGSASQFTFRLRHECSTCSPQVGGFTTSRTFTMGDIISGRVLLYDGVAGLSGGKCTSGLPPVQITQSGGEQISVTRGGTTYTTGLNADGTYSITVPVTNTGLNNVSYSSGTGSNVCGCPTGCAYPSANTPISGLNFYFLEDRNPWWQAIGGHLLALRSTGTAISTQIPETCSESLGCQRYLDLRDLSNTTNSSGTLLTGGGNIDTRNDAGTQTDAIDQDGRNINAKGIQLSGVTENYAFFYRQFSMGVNPTEDIGGGANSIPNPPPSNGRAYYRNGNFTLSSATNIPAGQKKTIFINGNLTITNTINVMEGGFLAFIVKGNITIDRNVCQSDPTSTDGVVEGVYVADGTITIAGAGSADCKFVGEGVFAGWGGISLGRDFRDGGAADALNSTNPVELFKYRPDFMVNLPEEMTRPLYLWQEVAP